MASRYRNKNRNSRGKVAKWKVALLSFEALVIVMYLLVTSVYAWYKVDKIGFIKAASKSTILRGLISGTDTAKSYEKNVQDKDFNKDNVKINEGVSKKTETYLNIALFGIDSRSEDFDDGSRSDSIIVVSINSKTGKVRMASVYRDTMLKITDSDGDVTYTKANAGFAIGGAEGAINMLNTNLDLNITDYAVVNFTGLATIIDKLGGIDVKISWDELTYINGYLTETRKITGLDTPDLTAADYGEDGLVHLTGLQATAFCRIRYVPFTDVDGQVYRDDYGRTARQRFVIKQLVEKAKAAGSDQVISIAKDILNQGSGDEKIFATSLSINEIFDLIPTVLDFELGESIGFPFTCDTPKVNGASMVVAQGLTYNVSKLHDAMFDEKNYEPSSTVKEISDYITSYTGVPTVVLEGDEDTVNEYGSTSNEDDYSTEGNSNSNY